MGALCLGGKDLMISKRALLLESPVWVLCRSTQYAVCLLGYLPSLVDQSIVIVPSRNSRVPRVCAACKVRPAGTCIGTINAQETVHDLENLSPMFFHNRTTSICRLSI